MEKITLQRNMDDGYGTVHCIQKQDFKLNEIHEFFMKDKPFDNIDSVISYLEDKIESGDYDFLNDIMCDLNDSEGLEHFHSIANPNGSGNTVDSLVVTYEGEIIFEH